MTDDVTDQIYYGFEDLVAELPYQRFFFRCLLLG